MQSQNYQRTMNACFIAYMVQTVSQWASLFAEKGLGVTKTIGDLAGPMSFAMLMGTSRLLYGKYGEKWESWRQSYFQSYYWLDWLPYKKEKNNMSEIQVRAYTQADLPDMIRIWNEVVEDGIAFPQEENLLEETGKEFFGNQTYSAVAEDTATGEILGLYILHPNNVGRCGHICNASYAVAKASRGLHIGEKLVQDCLKQAPHFGYKVLQFNAVVASNVHARHLYERLGFVQLGVIPGGFRMKDGTYEDICPYYHEL